MDKLNKAQAMKCFGNMVEIVAHDPDPKAQEELEEEYNCFNCDAHFYCRTLEDTLKQ